jgi:hypothetical protein
MVEERRAGCAEEAGELGPRIRAAHIDDANRFDVRPGRFDPIGPRGLASLDAAPKSMLGCDQKMLVERVGGNGHLDPFAPAGDDRQRRRPGVGHPHVVLELGHVLLDRGLFRERPGQHELGLEHGVDGVNEPVQRRGQISMYRVLGPSLDIGDRSPSVAFVPAPVQRLGGDAELDNEVAA